MFNKFKKAAATVGNTLVVALIASAAISSLSLFGQASECGIDSINVLIDPETTDTSGSCGALGSINHDTGTGGPFQTTFRVVESQEEFLPGDTITFELEFQFPIFVAGNPVLNVDFDNGPVAIPATSTTGTKIIFEHVVRAEDVATDPDVGDIDDCEVTEEGDGNGNGVSGETSSCEIDEDDKNIPISVGDASAFNIVASRARPGNGFAVFGNSVVDISISYGDGESPISHNIDTAAHFSNMSAFDVDGNRVAYADNLLRKIFVFNVDINSSSFDSEFSFDSDLLGQDNMKMGGDRIMLLDGPRALVVYEKSGNTWNKIDTVVTSMSSMGDYEISGDGRVIVMGRESQDDNVGALEIAVDVDGSGNYVSRRYIPTEYSGLVFNPSTGPKFGHEVTVSHDGRFVAAAASNDGGGRTYIFERQSGSENYVQTGSASTSFQQSFVPSMAFVNNDVAVPDCSSVLQRGTVKLVNAIDPSDTETLFHTDPTIQNVFGCRGIHGDGEYLIIESSTGGFAYRSP